MSLKGYEWLHNNKVVMSFFFKNLELIVWEKVSKEEEQKFVDYITKQKEKPIKITHWYKDKCQEN